jgi:hypothetical protein
MKVVCDECKNKFENKIYTRSFKLVPFLQIIQSYIKCDKCFKTYHVMYDNKHTLDLKDKINDLQDNYNIIYNNIKPNKANTRYKNNLTFQEKRAVKLLTDIENLKKKKLKEHKQIIALMQN